MPIEVDNLLNGQTRLTHDDKCFAMLHCAVIIAESHFEGAPIYKPLEYFQNVLALDFAYYQLPLVISNSEQEAARSALKDLDDFRKLFKEFNFSSKDEIDNSNQLKQVISEIMSRLEKQKTCYLPSGWLKKDGGHFVTLKVERHGDEGKLILCQLLNRGAGCELHRPHKQGKHKLKREVASDTYLIDLDSKLGAFFLLSILRMQVNLPDQELRPFSETELYGLLIQCGKPYERKNKAFVHSATPQRTGTCSVTNTLEAAKDALVNLHDTEAEKRSALRRFQIVIKTITLIEAYLAFRQNKCDADLMHWAMREFHVRLNKQHDITISNDELIELTKLSQALQNQLDQAASERIKAACAPWLMPQFHVKWQTKPVSQATSASKKANESNRSLESSNSQISTNIRASILPNEVATYIRTAVTCNGMFDPTCKELRVRCMAMRAFMHSLPIPSGQEEDKFWDALTSEDTLEIFNNLATLIGINSNLFGKIKSDREDDSPHLKLFCFENILIAYDIMAQIAMNLPILEFRGEYALGLDPIHHQADFFFNPESYLTIKNIEQRFATRCTGKRVIFPSLVNYRKNDDTLYYLENWLNPRRCQNLEQHFKLKQDSDSKQTIIKRLLNGRDHSYVTKTSSLFARSIEKNPAFEIESIVVASTLTHSLGTMKLDQLNKVGYWVDQACLDSTRWYAPCTPILNLEKISQAIKNPKISEYDRNTVFNIQLSQLPKNMTPTSTFSSVDENTVFSISSRPNSKNRETELCIFQPEPCGTIFPFKSPASRFDQTMRDAFDQDMRQIECTPQLQVQRILIWATKNIEYLHKANERISELLFSYGKLDFALQTNRNDVLSLMYNFLIRGIKHYSRNNARDIFTTIWLCQLHHHLKSYAQLFASDQVKSTWPDLMPLFKNGFDRLCSSDKFDELTPILIVKFAQAMLMNYQYSQFTSLEDVVMVLRCQLLINVHSSNFNINRRKLKGIVSEQNNSPYSDESDLEAIMVWKDLTNRLDSFFEVIDSEARNSIINQVINTVVAIPVKTSWQYQRHSFLNVEHGYEIQLISGALFHYGTKVEDLSFAQSKYLSIFGLTNPNSIHYAPKTKLLVKNDGRRPDDEVWETSCGQWKINKEKAYRTIKIDGSVKLFQVIHNISQSSAVDDILKYFKKYNINTVCAIDENTVLLVNPYQPNEVILEHHVKPNSAYIYRDGLGWKKLAWHEGAYQEQDELVINLSSPNLPFLEGWRQYFAPLKHLINQGEVHLNYEVSELDHFQLKRLIFSQLKLSFRVKEDRLLCEQFPTLYLASVLSVPELFGKYTLILQNKKNEKSIVLPYSISLPGISPYHICHYDKQGNLVGDSLLADFNLMLFYRSRNEFKEAFRCLQRTFCHENNSESVCSLFRTITSQQKKINRSCCF